MSQNDDAIWAHFNVRCEKELREKVEVSAKERGQSLAEWVRRAMIEKLQRDEGQCITGISNGELAEIIKETVLDMKKDKII